MISIFLYILSTSLLFASVYPDVAHQRRDLEHEEKQRLLRLGGCSASALTKNIIITAQHCYSFKTGYFEADKSKTFQIVKTLEQSSLYENDYAIHEIKWDSGPAPTDLIVTKNIVTDKNELIFGEDKIATILYVIGYPYDRKIDGEKIATFSWGYLKGEKLYAPSKVFKTKEALYVTYNAPVTGGNSGGPIYKEDYSLVAIVSAGDGAPMDSDRASSDFTSQNSKFWNLGGALYYIYPKSKILQKLYPKK
jgi:V8-like Glu-specific endopeptidase